MPIALMLATLTNRREFGDDWLLERKFDGERCVARRDGGDVRLESRTARDLTGTYPEVRAAVGVTDERPGEQGLHRSVRTAGPGRHRAERLRWPAPCNDKCDREGGQKDRPDGKHDRCDTCDAHQAKGPNVSQDLDQKARTDQSGDSNQENWQILPINANFGASHPGGTVPWSGGGKDCGCSDHTKGYGRSGGSVTQTSQASPTNIRINQAKTIQWADRDQDVKGTGQRPGGQDWQPGSNDCGCSQQGKDGSYDTKDGHGPDGSGVSQDADQHAGTDQSGDSNQENWQIAPINVNAPISVLSDGSNNGDVRQSNEASPTNVRENQAVTGQFAGQNQDVDQPAWGGGGAVRQDGDQSSYTNQSGDSNQENVQVLPVNVNAPISVLSHGSNNGDVHQSNDASPTNFRSNQAGTLQGIGQSQAVGSLK